MEIIHINITDDKWKEFEEYHKRYIERTVINNWKKFNNSKIDNKEKELVKKVFENQGIIIPKDNDDKKEQKLETIFKWCVSDNIDELADVTKEKLFENTGVKDEGIERSCIKDIINIFGYYQFSEGTQHIKMKDGKIWCRHSFMNELGIKVCPYCNREYITSYYESEESNKKVRTTTDTDHYYPKSYFPLLSMNIYNMVPSCSICNSRMKLDKVKCKDDAHLYPYRDASDSLKFEIPFSNIEELYGFSEDNITIQLQTAKQGDVSNRAEQSKEIFKLEQVYEAHKDVVFKLLNTIKNYSKKSYERIFCENYIDIFDNYDDFKKVLYPFLSEDENNTPLVKMQKDIYKYIHDKVDF